MKRRHGDCWKTRNESLAALGFTSYRAYLKSPLWRSIKSRRRKLKGGKICVFCGAKATQFHHDNYDAKTMAGGNLRALIPCCRRCHSEGSRSDEGWALSPSMATGRMNNLSSRRSGEAPLKRKKRKRRKKMKKPVSPERAKWIAACAATLEDLALRRRVPRGRQSGLGAAPRKTPPGP